MTMQQTSLMAYAEVKTKLNTNQTKVLQALEEISPANNRMIAEHIGWPINAITPRVLELRNKGKVMLAYVGKDVSGRSANYWKTKQKSEYGDAF